MRALIWILIIYFGYRLIKSLTKAKSKPVVSENSPQAETTFRDPVCGVYVSEHDAVVGRLAGERHYFCSMNCLEKFTEQLDHTSHNGGNS
ncbi:MAG TPA: hypothetical protein VGJ93_10200 [Desulfuromonadaceae bacterium]